MLDLSKYAYITLPQFTGSIEDDAALFLRANNKHKIREHVINVAGVAAELANQFGLDCDIARTAAMLHDISGVLKPDDMMAYALACAWWVDESEKKYPFLLHQRISRCMAQEMFVVKDETILSMIECHTTLKNHASDYDIVLFLADKLAWDRGGTPPYYDEIRLALRTSLMHAAKEYFRYAFDNNMILYPHTWMIEAKGYLQV